MEEKQENEMLFEENDTEQYICREKTYNRTFINRYLKDYRRAYSHLRAAQFTRKFGSESASCLADAEDAAFHARMFEIKLFISSLDSGDEKMFLYYYYIKGLTMEKCAKALGISRRSVYRLKIRSLDFALEKYLSK